MKVYISFGQIHCHEVLGTIFDANCLALIEAETENAARETAFDLFGDKFYTSYTEKQMTPDVMKCFPRGVIKVELPEEPLVIGKYTLNNNE